MGKTYGLRVWADKGIRARRRFGKGLLAGGLVFGSHFNEPLYGFPTSFFLGT